MIHRFYLEREGHVKELGKLDYLYLPEPENEDFLQMLSINDGNGLRSVTYEDLIGWDLLVDVENKTYCLDNEDSEWVEV